MYEMTCNDTHTHACSYARHTIGGKARFLFSLPFPPSSNVWNDMQWYSYSCKPWIGIGGIRLEWICVGCWICVGYVWDTFGMDMCGMCWICVGYVWDTFGMDMCGICVVCWICVGYVWDTFGMDMCGICVVCWICVGYVWDTFGMDMCGICVVCWICVGYVWDTFGMDMCGICVVCWICVGYVWCEIRQQSSEEPCDETSFGNRNFQGVPTNIFPFKKEQRVHICQEAPQKWKEDVVQPSMLRCYCNW